MSGRAVIGGLRPETTMLVYTTEQGGTMHPSHGGSKEYELIKEKGYVMTDDGQRRVAMIALCRVEEMWDFRL